MKQLTDLIAPSFYTLHSDIKSGVYTHYWLKGGRGSTKSSFISLEIVLGMMEHPDANAVVIRKVGLYLKDSVYEQICWAIEALGVAALWQAKLSPLEIRYLPTGQKILFRGADKPRKLKSTKVAHGYVRYIWYEECDEFAGIEEIRTVNQSLMRGGAKFDVFYSYNPPKSQNNWVNNEVLLVQPGKRVHHSTYRAVPRLWLGEQFFIEAEHLAETKPEQYEHEYLGKVTGTGGEVFTNVQIRPITDEEISGFGYLRRGIDWGYTTDPFCYVALCYDRKHKRIYIYYEYYAHGAKFDVITQAIRRENKTNHLIMAESADPRSNAELVDRGLRVQKVKKQPGSVEHGITWLQNLEAIVIDPVRCPNTAREFLHYELERDGNDGFREGFPDKDNHSIDAVRYALNTDMAKRRAKVLNKAQYGLH